MTLAPLARCPLLTHPGVTATERLIREETTLTVTEAILPAGATLLEALGEVLDSTDGLALVGRLEGGTLESTSYYIPDVGSPGGPVATFSAPRRVVGPARLDRGGLTVGHRDGSVFAHSHALFSDAGGNRLAGHLIPDSVRLGEGVRARVWVSADVALEVQPDPETLMSLFVPRRARRTNRGESRAVVCRVRPNVDLVGVIVALVEEQGWDAAEVCGQIGSLVGATLRRSDGSVMTVDGPATEVMLLDGEVRRVDGRVRVELDAQLVDRHALVHRGRLVAGQNAVAMTYELVLVETSVTNN